MKRVTWGFTVLVAIAALVWIAAPAVSQPKVVKIGDLGSTFGGGPLACALIEATIDTIEEEGLLPRVRAQPVLSMHWPMRLRSLWPASPRTFRFAA